MILGILGSPRKDSNSGILLDEALRGAASNGAEVKKICLGDLDFKGCISCGGCDKTGVCVLKDGMTPIYKELRDADAVILASPVYFAGITSQLKAMIDRCQSEWVAKQLGDRSGGKVVVGSDLSPRRFGAFICISGHKKNIFFECAKKPVEAFFKVLGIDFVGELFFTGVENAGDIKNIKGSLEEAYKLGVKLLSKK